MHFAYSSQRCFAADVRSHAPISFAFPPALPGRQNNNLRHYGSDSSESLDEDTSTSPTRRRQSGAMGAKESVSSAPNSPTGVRKSVFRDADPRVTQPLFIIDDSRAPAVPPTKVTSATRLSLPPRGGKILPATSRSPTLRNESQPPKVSSESLDIFMSASESADSSTSSHSGDTFSVSTTSTPASRSTHATTASLSSAQSSPGSLSQYAVHIRTQPQSSSSQHQRAYRDTNTLPNRTLVFDVKSLHLHLATRVQEVLACAEAMWEWVQAEQDLAQARERGRRMHGLHGRGLHGANFGYGYGPYVHGLIWERQPKEADWANELQAMAEEEADGDPQMDAIRKLSRSDFDALLTQFEMYVPYHLLLLC